MIAIKLAFVFLVFNVFVSTIAGANIFTGTIYYDPSFANAYSEDNLPRNISTTSTDFEYPATASGFDLIVNTVTFNWLNKYASAMNLEDEFQPLIIGLNAIGGFLLLVAFIEIYMKRSGVLGT